MNIINDLAYQINLFSNFAAYNISHIGANNGEDLNELRKLLNSRHRGCEYIGYEANKYWCDKVFAKNIQIINKAVGNTEGLTTFNLVENNDRNCSSFLTRVDEWGKKLLYKPIECEMIKGSSIINTPCVLIIDSEGMSYDILQSFGQKLHNIKVIMLEAEHTEIFIGQKLYSDISDLLTSNGFIQTYFAYEYKNQSNSIWFKKEYFLT